MSTPLDTLRLHHSPFIVYVGDALPTAAGLPSRRAVAQGLLVDAEDYVSARQHRELAQLGQGPDLAAVFSELERALTPAGFGRTIERMLADDACEVPALGRAVAALGQQIRGVITPNLDHLLERAFEGELTVHPTPVADLASRRGWLLKIHGTLRDRSTWVFTTEQQGRVLYRDPLHREVFRSLFLAHPIVFVGTRLDDPVLNALLQQVQALAQGQPPRHWALVHADEAGPIRRRQLAAAGVELVTYGDETECLALLGSLVRGGNGRAPQGQGIDAASTPLAVSAGSEPGAAAGQQAVAGGGESPQQTASGPGAVVGQAASGVATTRRRAASIQVAAVGQRVSSPVGTGGEAVSGPIAAATQGHAASGPGATPGRVVSNTAASVPPERSILLIAANPAGTDPLRLDRELRIIREAIERSRHRTRLRLEVRPAATVHDLRRALLEGQFDVVHISGHGEEQGLVLEDDAGNSVPVARLAVARLFARYAAPAGPLRCVVLNACWSRLTGEQPAMNVPFTVAMDGPVSDQGAQEFSRGFYDALGAGMDYDRAYEEGCSSAELGAPGARFESVLLRG
ncbi:MAG: SIR2 family protein [Deltaproteobacteria bacterium]|nr:SIR2 family protein [Deltaproteobacteria bacterium]